MKKEKSKERTEEYFNSTAADYDNSHDGRFVRCMYQEILNRMEHIQASRILDLGCGNGNVIALLREQRPASYYGLDISQSMIREAKKRLGDQVTLDVGDAEELPYENQSFDLIICNASFHHYPNPQKALKEMKRVLQPGGIILLGDPTLPGRFFTSALNWFMKYSDSGDAKIWSKKEIIKLFETNGFQVKGWKYINYQSFMFEAVRKEEN